MGRHARLDAATVLAARDGDKGSLDELVAEYLPLVYNIVGRALDGHADVDDVVQETMLRVVRKLKGLRDSTRFRSWLVAIAMQQVRARARARQEALARTGLDEAGEIPDPDADFVDLTITQLVLTGQRKEVAEATRWLDPDDRQLLSLWWLEAAGELSRDELAAGLSISTAHAAVRIQRMRAQLHAARVVVRALWSDRHCAGLIDLLEGWDARPSTLWRKRLVRHTRDCDECGRHWVDLVPAERLLAGLTLLPIPVGLAATFGGGAAGHTALVDAFDNSTAEPDPDDFGVVETWVGHARDHLARPYARAAVSVAAVVLAIAVVYVIVPDRPSTGAPDAGAAGASPSAPAAEPTPRDTESAARGSRAERAPAPPVDAHVPPRPPAYGSNVDRPDEPPPADRRPGALPARPELAAVQAVDGDYSKPYRGDWLLLRERGDRVTLQGQGYFQVRWTIGYYNCGGEIVMPTWTGLDGKLFHAASGGGRRLDDHMPGTYSAGHTWMGSPGKQQATLPAGAQQMWQTEFYYLHGEVTLHHNQGLADYDLLVAPRTRYEVSQDILQGPDQRRGVVRYGQVRDTGNDGAPVPQYLTRLTPADPRTVPQRSQVLAA